MKKNKTILSPCWATQKGRPSAVLTVFQMYEEGEWVPRIYECANKTHQLHVLFNTNYQAQSVINSRQVNPTPAKFDIVRIETTKNYHNTE